MLVLIPVGTLHKTDGPSWPRTAIAQIPSAAVTITSFQMLITPVTQGTHDPPPITFPLGWLSVLFFYVAREESCKEHTNELKFFNL